MSLAEIALLAGALRVFSADYCADQMLLALADRAQIAALSVDAEKDFSYLRDKAKELPQARAGAEEVMAARADIVLRYWGGDAARLRRLGVKVVTLDYAADLDAVKANIRTAATAIGQTRAGARMIADIDGRLARLSARPPADISALYVTPGGVTAGKGTMIDAIFTAAGVRNAAAEAGHSYWPPLSAEALILSPPQFMATGFFTAESERINNWSASRHPALKRALRDIPRIDLPADVLACPGWFSLDAAEAIRAAVDEAEAGGDD